MTIDAARPFSPAPADRRVLRCALINNMPDSALVETERQFLRLLGVGVGSQPTEVRRYALAGIPRGPRSAAYLRQEYLPLDDLWDSEPDAIIVTGSEPLSDSLADEPYWSEIVRLLDWAVARPISLLLSCLSAHAALLALDGLDRTPLPGKCSGVFAHEVVGAALTDGMDRPALMPHSRGNDVPTAAVAAAGWEVLLDSSVGWGVVTARRSQAELLLVQGHPEYGPSTLLREYRRDVIRYLRGERPCAPDLPDGSVNPADREAIVKFHCELLVSGRDGALIETFPFDEVGARADGVWRGMAELLFTNWIAGVTARRPASGAQRRPSRI